MAAKKPATKTPAFPGEAVEPPPDLATAFSTEKAAKVAWDKLAPSHRREYAEWINEAKQAATRKRRVDYTIAQLLEPATPRR